MELHVTWPLVEQFDDKGVLSLSVSMSWNRGLVGAMAKLSPSPPMRTDLKFMEASSRLVGYFCVSLFFGD